MHVALTGSHFAGMLAAYVESEARRTPLCVSFFLLDPADRESWSFVYRLREARALREGEVDRFLAQDRVLQERTEDVVSRLTDSPQFTGRLEYYSGIPLFWAYWIDGNRIVAGQLAMGRTSGRSLPVSVIVRDDPRTSALYRYYAATIDSLAD